MEIFFNSSLPRSLSTLLQNVIGQNPDFYVTPTDGVLELLYSARQNYANSLEFKAQDSELMKKGWLGFCKSGLYGFYNSITDKPYVVSKSRGWGLHYNFLQNVLGKPPKIICMVRDLKNIVSSLEKIHRQKESYSTDMLIDHSKMQNTSTPKRVDYFLSSPPLGLALERLSEIIRLGISQNFLFIRAEDFSQNPKKEMNRVYEYLELPKFEHDFSNVEQITQEDDEIYGLTNNLHQIKKSITPLVDDSTQILGSDISKWIDETPQFDWYRKAFGYGKWKYKGDLI